VKGDCRWLPISAGRGEIFKGVEPVGVGLVESGIGLTRLLLQRERKGVIFVGTIGSYGKLKIGDEVWSCVATQLELGKMENRCYSPISLQVKNRHFSQWISQFTPYLPSTQVKINSSNYITTDWKSAPLFRKEGVEGESMEFFTILKVAEKFQLPAVGYFVVTNYTNSTAHRDYLQNLPVARRKIENFLSSLTPFLDVI
jgi:purine-nucleoside phosphorylase